MINVHFFFSFLFAFAYLTINDLNLFFTICSVRVFPNSFAIDDHFLPLLMTVFIIL
jgi:hypothetical protein